MSEGQKGEENVVHFLDGLKDEFYVDGLAEIDDLITAHFDSESDTSLTDH